MKLLVLSMALLCVTASSSQTTCSIDESILLAEIQHKTDSLVSPRQARDLIRGITPSVTFVYQEKQYEHVNLFHVQSFDIVGTVTLRSTSKESLPKPFITRSTRPSSVMFVWQLLGMGILAFFAGMFGLWVANGFGTKEKPMEWYYGTVEDAALIITIIALYSLIIGILAAAIAVSDYRHSISGSLEQWLFESTFAFAGGITRIMILVFRNNRDLYHQVQKISERKPSTVS